MMPQKLLLIAPVMLGLAAAPLVQADTPIGAPWWP